MDGEKRRFLGRSQPANDGGSKIITMRLFKAIKVFGSGASVVGFGYLLMRFTTPTDEELVSVSFDLYRNEGRC